MLVAKGISKFADTLANKAIRSQPPSDDEQNNKASAKIQEVNQFLKLLGQKPTEPTGNTCFAVAWIQFHVIDMTIEIQPCSRLLATDKRNKVEDFLKQATLTSRTGNSNYLKQ